MQNYAALEDDELLGHLKKGDGKAFTEVYHRYWQKLLAIGLFFTHDKQQAEDIIHEVMMSLWIRKNELAIDSLEAYLATAVKFSVFKAIARNKKRRELLANNPIEETEPGIEEKLEARFLDEFLKGEIEKLPSKARLVFRYSREDALTVKEIAEKMELSPKAVEYHITKALKSLKDALKKIKSFFI